MDSSENLAVVNFLTPSQALRLALVSNRALYWSDKRCCYGVVGHQTQLMAATNNISSFV